MSSKTFRLTPNLTPFKEMIDELANELVYNHFANSFGDSNDPPIYADYIFDNNKTDAVFEEKYFGKSSDSFSKAFHFRKERKTRLSCRNILIVGAGASHDSYSYIPLGETLRKELENHFINDISKSTIINKKYEEEKKNINRLIKGEFDFENCLSLLSNFIPHEDLLSRIKEFTGFRYEPSLFYEIVAHLFKHHFIDVIINFNFDELLDNAIEEEVGKQNYHYILHDGDCVSMADIVEDSRLKIPVYIKPHGTSRHTTTLRFTKRHYLDISPEIKNLLKSLIGGERESKDKDPISRINLICVGFDLTSIEFNEILNENLPPESRIYHIAFEKFSKERLDNLKNVQLSNFFSKSSNEFDKTYKSVEIKGFEKDKIITPYSELFCVLWRSIYNRFQEMYRPRSIGRHEILSYFFYRKDDKQKHQPTYYKIAKNASEARNKIRQYFLDRILVELALMLNRSDGIVDVIHLLNGRIGEYFGLYTKQALLCNDDDKFTIYQLLGEFTRERELEKDGIQSEFIYSRNVFKIIPFEESEFEKLLDEIKSFPSFINASSDFISEFRRELQIIHKKQPITSSLLYRLFTSDKISDVFIHRFINDYNKDINNGLRWNDSPKSLMNEIFRIFSKSAPRNYFYIRSKYNDHINDMWESFDKKNLLHTSLAYKYHFRHHFLDPRNWDALLCVSESGSLIDFIDSLQNNQKEYSSILGELQSGKKRLVMICSYETVKQLHYNSNENVNIIELINIHKNYLASKGSNIVWNTNAIDLLLMPYWQHNHHSIIFLRKANSQTITKQGDHDFFYKLDKNHDIQTKFNFFNGEGLLFNSSYYYYKKGFSNSINPLFIGQSNRHKPKLALVSNDQMKLMSLFYTYICRSIVFLSEIEDDETWLSQQSPFLKDVVSLKEYLKYTQWDKLSFDKNMTTFLSYLYTSIPL